jgi:hypothetical protein
VGRISSVLLMVLAALFAMQLKNALQGFQIIVQIGAGTGPLFIMRWFWWRINACSEIAAMIVSFVVALWSQFGAPTGMPAWQKFLIQVAVTTIAWVSVTFLTPPDDESTLRAFCARVRPGGWGWRGVVQRAREDGQSIEQSRIGPGIGAMVAGSLAIYGTLFAVGFWLYGQVALAIVWTGVALVAGVILRMLWEPVHT